MSAHLRIGAMTLLAMLAAAPLAAQEAAPASAPAPARTPAPPGSYLYIGWPNDGEVLGRKPFRVWFGLRNMGVAPAGIKFPNTGHHHLLVDVDEMPFLDEPIPNDKNHLHFGIGQSEATIELPPGKHTLQLIMGDHAHIPHDPPVVSKKITVTVR
jgi:hypothetical protein